MPGIVALIGPCDPHWRRHRLGRMLASMQNEPFYASGLEVDESLQAGCGWVVHQGSFADAQPLRTDSGDLRLVFCGEDFSDAHELDALRWRGVKVDPQRPDYLLRWCEAEGPAFVERLNGGVTGIVIDRRRGEVMLFNDRYGLNRLYVCQDGGLLYAASEAKALLAVLPQTRSLDPVALAEFLACGCVLQQRTLFPGIALLPPASRWTVPGGNPMALQRERYFDIAAWEALPALSADAYGEAMASTFADIVPKYLRGPATVGISLTGGLDGRMIMACAPPDARPRPCYTFGGSYRDCHDVLLAREVARRCGQDHAVIAVGDDFIDDFPTLAADCVRVSDGTMDVTGAVELYANRIARRIAPVRLTGNYGSEILRRNVAFKAQPLHRELFNADLQALGERAAATYASEARGHPLSFIATKQVPWHHPSRLSLEQSQLTMRSPYLDHRLVRLAYQAPPSLQHSPRAALQVIARDPALGRLPTDRGLTLRQVPVWSRLRHLQREFGFRAEYAYDYGMPPWLARVDHALSALRLERLFLGRHKFYHFRVWYRDRLGAFLQAMLLDRRSLERSHLAPGSLPRLLKQHLAGTHNHTTALHQALSVELMHRCLIEEHTA